MQGLPSRASCLCAVPSEKRAALIPHALELMSNATTVASSVSAETAQTALPQQLRSGVTPARRSADGNGRGRSEQKAGRRRPRHRTANNVG